jgi:hypothetical protein
VRAANEVLADDFGRRFRVSAGELSARAIEQVDLLSNRSRSDWKGLRSTR